MTLDAVLSWVNKLKCRLDDEGIGIEQTLVWPPSEYDTTRPKGAEVFRIMPSEMWSRFGVCLMDYGMLVIRDYGGADPVTLCKMTHPDQVVDLLTQIRTGLLSTHLTGNEE